MQAKNTAKQAAPEVREKTAFQGRLLLAIAETTGGKWMRFAKRAGIPKNTFQRYLDAEDPSKPRLDQLEKIAKAANRSVQWFISGEDDEAPAPSEGVEDLVATLLAKPFAHNPELDALRREAPGFVEQEWDPHYQVVAERAQAEIKAVIARTEEDLHRLQQNVIRLWRAERPKSRRR